MNECNGFIQLVCLESQRDKQNKNVNFQRLNTLNVLRQTSTPKKNQGEGESISCKALHFFVTVVLLNYVLVAQVAYDACYVQRSVVPCYYDA